MGKMMETPRYRIVSLRISDEEYAMIRNLKDESRQSVSEILRDALSLFFREADCCGEDGFPCRNES